MSDDFTFKVSESPKVIVKINSDGSVHVTDGHTLDDAAQAFWRTVELAGPKKEIERLTAELAAARGGLDAAVKDTLKYRGQVATLREALVKARRGILSGCAGKDAADAIDAVLKETGADNG